MLRPFVNSSLCVALGALLVIAGPTMAATPDLNGGTWRAIDPAQTLRTTDGKEPPLLAEAKAVYAKNVAARKAGDLSFDITEKCRPPGLPRVMYMPGELGTFEFLQRPDQIIILYEWNRLRRIVDLNTSQRALISPQYLGQSVGHWEGNTLVIDSIGFMNGTVLDAAGLPHGDALHITERYTPARDGKSMTVRTTIEDPKTYARPWETTLKLRHDPHGKIREDICLERKHIDWGKFRNAE